MTEIVEIERRNNYIQIKTVYVKKKKKRTILIAHIISNIKCYLKA